MSLYGTPDKSQKQSPDGEQIPKLPKWVLLLLWWVFVVSVLDGAHRTVQYFRYGFLNPEEFGFVLNGVSTLIASAFMLIYIFKRRSWILWSLIVVTIAGTIREILVVMDFYTGINHYGIILSGLEFVPLEVVFTVARFFGAEKYMHSSMYIFSPMLAVGVCALSLYFHFIVKSRAKIES